MTIQLCQLGKKKIKKKQGHGKQIGNCESDHFVRVYKWTGKSERQKKKKKKKKL